MSVTIIIKTSLYFFLLASFTQLSFGHAKTITPEVVNYYPQCDYLVLDTVEVRQRTAMEANALNPLQYQKAFRKIVSKLEKLAKSVNADLIVLTEKLNKDTHRQNYLSYKAELIRACKVNHDLPKKLAKFNAQGEAQLSLATTTLEIENTFVINMAFGNKRIEPDLLNNNISVYGAYGVKLNDNAAHVIEVLGTPTVDIKPNENLQILMYGRSHTFQFINDKLTVVASFNDDFTLDFKNMLEFDDRFDDLIWQIDNQYRRNTTLNELQTAKIKNDRMSLVGQSSVLSIYTEKLTDDTVSTFNVKNFLLSKSQRQLLDKIVPPNSQKILAFINDKVTSPATTFLVKDIPFTPTSVAWVGPTKRLFTFGQHVVVEVVGERIKTVHILENLYNKTTRFYQPQEWQIGGYTQNMTKQELQQLVSSNSEYVNGKIEINNHGVNMAFYFYEQKGQSFLYAAEINFY